MDTAWLEVAASLGLGLGLAAATGLRVFLPLLVLGGAARFGWLSLGGGFEWLASTPGLSTLAVATLLEVAAYYVPWVDNLLDVVAGPLAVMAGILVTAAVTADWPLGVRWAVAIVAGGGTAGVVQGLTAMARLQSSGATGGIGNPVLATLELLGSLFTSILAILMPLVAVVVLVGLAFMVRRVGRAFRRTRVSQAS